MPALFFLSTNHLEINAASHHGNWGSVIETRCGTVRNKLTRSRIEVAAGQPVQLSRSGVGRYEIHLLDLQVTEGCSGTCPTRKYICSLGRLKTAKSFHAQGIFFGRLATVLSGVLVLLAHPPVERTICVETSPWLLQLKPVHRVMAANLLILHLISWLIG